MSTTPTFETAILFVSGLVLGPVVLIALIGFLSRLLRPWRGVRVGGAGMPAAPFHGSYAFHCVRCPSEIVWTTAGSAREAERLTLGNGWEQREDGLICFLCVYREAEKAQAK